MHNVVWGCAEILPQTYLNREGSGIGMSKLQNFRRRCVKTFIIQRSIRNFHTFLRISWVYLNMSTHSKGDPPVARHGIPLKRYLTWNPDVFQAKKNRQSTTTCAQ